MQGPRRGTSNLSGFDGLGFQTAQYHDFGYNMTSTGTMNVPSDKIYNTHVKYLFVARVSEDLRGSATCSIPLRRGFYFGTVGFRV